MLRNQLEINSANETKKKREQELREAEAAREFLPIQNFLKIRKFFSQESTGNLREARGLDWIHGGSIAYKDRERKHVIFSGILVKILRT